MQMFLCFSVFALGPLSCWADGKVFIQELFFTLFASLAANFFFGVLVFWW